MDVVGRGAQFLRQTYQDSPGRSPDVCPRRSQTATTSQTTQHSVATVRSPKCSLLTLLSQAVSCHERCVSSDDVAYRARIDVFRRSTSRVAHWWWAFIAVPLSRPISPFSSVEELYRTLSACTCRTVSCYRVDSWSLSVAISHNILMLVPSREPSREPSRAPSRAPSWAPSRAPSWAPSRAPSRAPLFDDPGNTDFWWTMST